MSLKRVSIFSPDSLSMFLTGMSKHLTFDLIKLENDLKAHEAAVVSGRTSTKQKEHIR